MTHHNELKMIWSELANTYQLLNSTTGKAERSRLKALSEMLRIEYRMLTSTYTTPQELSK
ncbi:MAG: hypothetical protein CL831_00580 [Crocinitomicaceae bacterium]|nr:hypothetical protein [Crocinitomicaceae bacterium]